PSIVAGIAAQEILADTLDGVKVIVELQRFPRAAAPVVLIGKISDLDRDEERPFHGLAAVADLVGPADLEQTDAISAAAEIVGGVLQKAEQHARPQERLILGKRIEHAEG